MLWMLAGSVCFNLLPIKSKKGTRWTHASGYKNSLRIAKTHTGQRRGTLQDMNRGSHLQQFSTWQRQFFSFVDAGKTCSSHRIGSISLVRSNQVTEGREKRNTRMVSWTAAEGKELCPFPDSQMFAHPHLFRYNVAVTSCSPAFMSAAQLWWMLETGTTLLSTPNAVVALAHTKWPQKSHFVSARKPHMEAWFFWLVTELGATTLRKVSTKDNSKWKLAGVSIVCKAIYVHYPSASLFSACPK